MVYLPLGSIMEWNGNKVTEHNRSGLSVSPKEIQVKKRMANGTLRLWTTAVKRELSVSFDNVPAKTSKTVDGAWGGIDMKNFYDTVSSFTLTIRSGDGTTQSFVAVISSFEYEIVKRGPQSDLWNITIDIEEV